MFRYFKITIAGFRFIFLTSCLMSVSCSTTKLTQTNMLPLFDMEGHRGCRGLMPENTIPAMIKALEMGVTTLEMDISISKDKKIFLSHEPFFNHEITTVPGGQFITINEERSYNLFQMNYDSIIKYDIGLKPHPRFPQQEKMKAVKPLLGAVFEAVNAHMLTVKRLHPFFNIETKTLPIGDNIYHPQPAEFVELLMRIIKEYKMEKWVIIQSFDFRTLQYLHVHYPKMKTAMLIEANNPNSFRKQLKDMGFTPTIYSPEFALVTKDLIKNCHDEKMKIIPWTVNDKKKIEELKNMGVDGIITDYPNLFND